MLTASDAVAAIITLEDGRYLLQHRDSIPNIWYPNHWGCFGGAIDPGENPEDAFKRELFEELELSTSMPKLFVQFDYDLTSLGMGKVFRKYFVLQISESAVQGLSLHEGQGMGIFSKEELSTGLQIVPYDAFAIHLHSDGTTKPE